MILKLKRLLEKIPFGKSILGRYAAALWLIKEQENWQNKTEDQFVQVVSCNTHNLSTIVQTMALDEGDDNLLDGKFFQ